MGLDMYIYRKEYKYRLKDGTFTNGKGMDFSEYYLDDEFGCSNGVFLTSTVAYWRKANAIHNWFVNNIQDGKDECQESYLTIENLKELYDICNRIVKPLIGKKIVMPDDVWANVKTWESRTKKEEADYTDPRKKEDVLSFDNWKYIYSYKMRIPKKVMEIIKNELPPVSGFFFGSTEIDCGYLYDVFKTIAMLERIFDEAKTMKKNGEYADYYYHASW